MQTGLYLRGFSLVELLLVVSIVGILASITVPSYSRHIDRSRRSDGIVALLRIQLAEEQQRAVKGAYTSDLRELGFDRALSSDEHYALSVQMPNEKYWIAVATPQGAQNRDDCGRLAIDVSGPVHTAPYADRRCWGR